MQMCGSEEVATREGLEEDTLGEGMFRVVLAHTCGNTIEKERPYPLPENLVRVGTVTLNNNVSREEAPAYLPRYLKSDRRSNF